MFTHSILAIAFLAMAAAGDTLFALAHGGLSVRGREALMLALLGGALLEVVAIATDPWGSLPLAQGLDGGAALCLLAAVGAFWPAVARLRHGALDVAGPRLRLRAERAESQAKAAAEWLDMAEQAGHVGHWQLSVPGNVLIWSDEMFRIHGLWREHYQPRLDSALAALHPLDGRRLSSLLRALGEQPGEFEMAARLRRPDGEQRQVLIRARARRGADGEVTALNGVMVDSTAPHKVAALPPAHAGAMAEGEDTLTGLAGRAQFDISLGYEFKRAIRSRKALGLLLLEIDQFGRYANRYGPRAAEHALREVAHAVGTLPRRTGDLVAYHADAQIAVLLPLADECGAMRVATQMMEAVRALGLPDDGRENGALTVSCGVAAFVGLDDLYNPAELTRKAARALADARLFGGDRVCGFREPVLPGMLA
jgi:diguanylate cyclase (GGDEF)-like protein